MRYSSDARKLLSFLCLWLVPVSPSSAHAQGPTVPRPTPSLELSLEIRRVFPSDPANDPSGRVYEQFVVTLKNTGADAYTVPDQTSHLWRLHLYHQGNPEETLPLTLRYPHTQVNALDPQDVMRVVAEWTIDTNPGNYNFDAEYVPTGATKSGTFTVPPPFEENILFTSKLMGYYRLPDKQSFSVLSSDSPCPLPSEDHPASRDARVFFQNFETHDADTILVGTGDNFAPNYYSRVLEGRRDRPKELYDWDAGQGAWTPYASPSSQTASSLEQGIGTIPTDNVGCFLSYVNYDALVPGKHDFYYGPERLRELARFLASMPRGGHFNPVQMLAANLFIKTTWARDHVPVPDSGKRPLPFTTKFIPAPTDRTGKVPPSPGYRNLEIADFTDGGFAFPWMQFVRVTATGWDPTLVKTKLEVFLCEAQSDDPDNFLNIGGFCKNQKRLWPDPDATKAAEDDVGKKPSVGPLVKPLVYRLPGPRPLLPGTNYAICIRPPEITLELRTDKDVQDAKPYCFRFSVYNPFFQFPNWADPEHSDPAGKYKNPKLYVLNETGKTPVVIFGVLDPQLVHEIGGDSLSWVTVHGTPGARIHREKKYTTELTIGDPVLALVHLQDHFEKQYSDEHPNHPFHGLRVLLAQMPPAEVKELAEHLPNCLRFDVIVSAAEDGIATPNQVLQVHPNTLDEAQVCPANVGTSGLEMKSDEFTNGALASTTTFAAVPPSHEQSPALPLGPTDPERNAVSRFLQVRELRVTADSRPYRTYRLSGDPIPVLLPDTGKLAAVANQFWQAVCNAIYAGDAPGRHCQATAQGVQMVSSWSKGLSSTVQWDNKVKKAAIEQLALLAIRQRYHADIALLQERDFYQSGLDDYLGEHCILSSENPLRCAKDSIRELDLQEILDRIVWKGDYAQVRSVKGSILKSILKQSDEYAKTEKAAYFPVSETGRPLVELGLRPDLANGGDFLINGKPLDPDALYTVVTSDHIALGDTGYSDLASPPVGDPPQPASSSETIVRISGRTCEALAEPKLWPGTAGLLVPDRSYCVVTLGRRNYYDELANRTPDDPRSGNTSLHKFYAWTFLHGDLGQPVPKNLQAQPGPDDIASETQKKIEALENWDFSLDKLSLGFAAVTHNGSEQELSNEFGGVQNAQVNAKHSHSWDWDADSKVIRYDPRFDLFLAETLQYSSSFTAQITPPRSETQSRNLFAIDGGTYLHSWSNHKSLPLISAVASGHFETQVGNPLTSISLQPIPPSTSPSTFNFKQGRTNLLLGRAGVRHQDRKSYIEGGLEGGQTLNAIQQFNILTMPGGPVVSCLLEASVSLTTCVNNFNRSNPTTPVTPSSTVTVVRRPQDRYGAYWTMGVTVPINPTISYNFQDTSDYFFLSHGDNSADTRFRHQLIHTLKFTVFPNLSFEPTYTIFLYENKVDYNFLVQQQYSVKINYSFDWTNWHESRQQLRYNKPSAQ